MKTLIAILTAAALLSIGAPKASADHGWSTTGKILTGMVIGGAVVSAFQPPPPTVVYAPAPVVYAPAPSVAYAPAPVYYAQPAPVYYAPAPVVVYSAPVYAPYRYYCAPPLVSFGFGFGGGYHHGGYYGGGYHGGGYRGGRR